MGRADEMQPFHAAIMLAYLTALVGVGVLFARRVRTGADFMVAGRGLSLPVLTGTLIATWIGSGTIVAGAGLAYRSGLSALWGSSGGWVGIACLLFVARRARRCGAFTVPDILETRYNPAARILGTLVTLAAYTVITSYQFRAGGMVLNLVTGLDPRTGTLLTAIFVIVYTALAGMLSVAWTDLVNGILLTAGILVALPVVLLRAGGLAGMGAALDPAFFSPANGETAGVGAVNLFLPTLLLLLGESNMYGRFFSARDEGTAHRAVIGWLIGVVALETCVALIGTAGRALYPDLGGLYPGLADPSEAVIPHLILTALPPAVGALLLAALAAVIVSTADSFLLTPAVNLQHDVWERFLRPWLRRRSGGLRGRWPGEPSERERIAFLRAVILLLGIWAWLQVALFPNVLQAALYAYTMYGAGVTPAILAAFFWKRATPRAGAGSVAAGMAATLAWEFVVQPALAGTTLGAVDPVLPAAAVSIGTLVLVSLTGPPPAPERWRPFFDSPRDCLPAEGD